MVGTRESGLLFSLSLLHFPFLRVFFPSSSLGGEGFLLFIWVLSFFCAGEVY